MGTSNNEKQKTDPQAVKRDWVAKCLPENPASISTRGMVTVSPKLKHWSQALEGNEKTGTKPCFGGKLN